MDEPPLRRGTLEMRVPATEDRRLSLRLNRDINGPCMPGEMVRFEEFRW